MHSEERKQFLVDILKDENGKAGKLFAAKDKISTSRRFAQSAEKLLHAKKMVDKLTSRVECTRDLLSELKLKTTC